MNIVLLVIGVVAAILEIIIRVLTKDTDYEKDGKHYAHTTFVLCFPTYIFHFFGNI